MIAKVYIEIKDGRTTIREMHGVGCTMKDLAAVIDSIDYKKLKSEGTYLISIADDKVKLEEVKR